MGRLVVEVLDASGDLIHEDGPGDASPFVEVEYEDQRQRTSAKTEDLSPFWNEKLVFDIKNSRDLPKRTIEVYVYSDNKNLLGEVRISGMSVPFDEQEAMAQRHPFHKRGHFSDVKGDIALKIYAVEDGIDDGFKYSEHVEVMKESNTNKFDDAERTEMDKITVGVNFLYVSVVKAKGLPVMDISGNFDLYVEVKVGDDKGVTKHLEKNRNPVWNAVFAFSKERLGSDLIEVSVKKKDIRDDDDDLIGKVVDDDDLVGKVEFNVEQVPQRVLPDIPLAPQWCKLPDEEGGIMLAVWMGTREDEAFLEARLSDAHSIRQQRSASTSSKVYILPKLYYLRVHVLSAKDLVPSHKGRRPDAFVRVQLGQQIQVTKHSPMKHINPEWNEELMFVVLEPLDDHYITIKVEDRVSKDKNEVIGRISIPVGQVPHIIETTKLLPDPQWLDLQQPSFAEKKKDDVIKFASRILLQLSIDGGYHVFDKSIHFSSDLQPSSKHLKKPSIGLVELGIISAQNLPPMKVKECTKPSTNAYCVAKYGNKWVRTRTLIDTVDPCWNEQYAWEVYDPCTVITIGVFNNNVGDDVKDKIFGKVRIRISTLETGRIYAYRLPLLFLTSSGLENQGELHLAIRFTCTALVNILTQCFKPLLPKIHSNTRDQAMQIVAAKLIRAEPPLRREIVEYMLDDLDSSNMFSLRRSKVNLYRIMSLLSGTIYVLRWFDDICSWKNPLTTILVHLLLLIPLCYPNLILPIFFLNLFVCGLWNYMFRARMPLHIDPLNISLAEKTHPDELDEEYDTYPSSRASQTVRMRYDRLRSIAGRVQVVIENLVNVGERVYFMLSWKAPVATAIFIIFLLFLTVFLYITPFQVVAALIGLYIMRHPRFRYKMPLSVPLSIIQFLEEITRLLISDMTWKE